MIYLFYKNFHNKRINYCIYCIFVKRFKNQKPIFPSEYRDRPEVFPNIMGCNLLITILFERTNTKSLCVIKIARVLERVKLLRFIFGGAD